MNATRTDIRTLLETDATDGLRGLLDQAEKIALIGDPEQASVRLTLTMEVDGAFASTRSEWFDGTIDHDGWTA